MATLKISSDLQNVIKKVVLDTYYPIGKTYITMGDEDPNKTIGGTWIKVSGGYLYATTTSLGQTSFYGWGTQSGGNGNSGSTTLTASQCGLPRHEHDMYDSTYGGFTNQMGIRGDGGGGSHKVPTYSQTNGWSTYRPAPAGGDNASEGHTHTIPAHSHDIATIDIFMWKRTA